MSEVRRSAVITLCLLCGIAVAARAADTRSYETLTKQRAAVAQMRVIGHLIDAYRTDHGERIPAGTSLEAVAKLLESTYTVDPLPRVDPWGTAYRYVASPDGAGYRVICAGSDKQFAPESLQMGAKYAPLSMLDSDDPAADIVWEAWSFSRQPADPPPPSDGIEASKFTMATMRMIAVAVEAYATDYDRFPPAATMDELSKALSPTYIRKVPVVDAWGTPFRYEVSDDGKSYRIVSAGSDRKFDAASEKAEKHETKSDAEDIVYADGEFKAWHPGTDRQ